LLWLRNNWLLNICCHIQTSILRIITINILLSIYILDVLLKDLKGLKKIEERKQRLGKILGNNWWKWWFLDEFECDRVVANGKTKLSNDWLYPILFLRKWIIKGNILNIVKNKCFISYKISEYNVTCRTFIYLGILLLVCKKVLTQFIQNYKHILFIIYLNERGPGEIVFFIQFYIIF
jgi:hypothetical protein